MNCTDATNDYHQKFSQMIRMMADELNRHRNPRAKTITINRIILYQLIDFMAIYQGVKDFNVAEELGISYRTLFSIKNEPGRQSPDYITMRTSTIDNVIQYTYDLAEIVEQRGAIIIERKR